MIDDVKVVAVFVALVILSCKAWSYFDVRQYKKNKEQKKEKRKVRTGSENGK